MILQLLVIFLIPALWIRFSGAFRVGKWLSPVVMSYSTGILLANFPVLPLNSEISKYAAEISILLAMPLLLYTTDLKGWLKYARSSVLSFTLCVMSGILASIAIALFFKDQLAENWMLSGMLVGVYTGGTPNMNAIGLALGANNETIVLMNAADVVCGGIYLIFLMSVAYGLFSKCLAPFRKSDETGTVREKKFRSGIDRKGLVQATGLTLFIVMLSLGICMIFNAMDNIAVILLVLTTLSIIAALFPWVRNIKGSFEMGEYLLLMFCVAIGMQADFGKLLAEGSFYIAFTALVLSATVVLHLLLARLFRIDADTFMITSTAALYGPVFIGQVAGIIKNRTLVFSGMATGLIGYAIGNYLGISIAYFVKWMN